MNRSILPLLAALACDRSDDKARPLPQDSGPAEDSSPARDDSDESAEPADSDESAEPTDSSDSAAGDDTSDSATPWTLPDRPDTDSPGASESWRWGGGEGYPDVVDPTWPVVTVVSTLGELSAALGAAVAGDIVYVADDAEIDLTGESLCVPAGVWLAGGRGVGGAAGGLLYATEGASDPILKACGDDVAHGVEAVPADQRARGVGAVDHHPVAQEIGRAHV